MPKCIIPGCDKEGTQLHHLEVPGSVHLLCAGHFELLFLSGMAGAEDLKAYNTVYQGILAERRAAARDKDAQESMRDNEVTLPAPTKTVELPDTELHSGPCIKCGQRIIVEKGKVFTLGVNLDGTRICPECVAKADKEANDAQETRQEAGPEGQGTSPERPR